MIGYARVSTRQQNEDRQTDALTNYGVDPANIFTDKASGKSLKREQYQLMKRTLRAGDILVIKSIDRLGRAYESIKDEFEDITSKGIHIHVLDMPILNTDQTITEGLTSKFIIDLVLSVLSYVAEQERAFIKQRQAEGIQSAKKRNVKFGRRDLDPKKLAEAKKLTDKGMSVKQACVIAGISRRSYYNHI